MIQRTSPKQSEREQTPTKEQKPTHHQSSPALDALVYVSSVELPKLSLNSTHAFNSSNNLKSSNQQASENHPSRVKAYAKLEFPQHDFFIRKLSIIIGRRPPKPVPKPQHHQRRTSPPPARTATTSPSNQGKQIRQPPSPSSASSSSSSSSILPSLSTPNNQTNQEQIDVDLGPIRAVSRKHAALFYDWNFGRWSIEVLGRNGCVIDGRWKAKSEIVPLRSRTKIQIAERIFHFMLPTSAEDLPPSSLVSPNQSTNLNQSVKIDPLNSLGNQSPVKPDVPNLPSHSNPTNLAIAHTSSISASHPESPENLNHHHEDQDEWVGCEADCESSLSLPCSPVTSGPSKPHQPQGSQSESEESDDEDDDDDDDHDDDPVGNLIDDDPFSKSDDEPRPPSPRRQDRIDYNQADLVDFNLIRSESDSDSVDDDDQINSSSELPYSYLPGKAPAFKAPKKTAATKAPTGRGKSAGKRPEARASNPQTDILESNQQSGKGLDSPTQVASGIGGTSVEKHKGSSTKTEIMLQVKERPKIECFTPPGAEIGTTTQKPPYTYASLIAQALASQADKDGKMLVSEMCEWMAGVYPFYGAKEKDWQSAVRHNLNADKRFKRIERTPTDGGKGNFWTLREEEWVHFDGLELRRPKEIKPAPPMKTETTLLAGTQRALGAPSRSIGTVARNDIGAHHRITTTQAPPLKSPTQPINHHGIRPSPPTPALQTDLPVFTDTINISPYKDPTIKPIQKTTVQVQSSQLSPQEPPRMDFNNDDNFNVQFSEDREFDQFPRPPSPMPAIDPNLLCSDSHSQSHSHSRNTTSSITQSSPPPPLPPAPVKAPTPSTTVTAKTVATIAPSKIQPKFEIIIQEPSQSSSLNLNSTPKTQEELKKLIESEPPMYTKGNQLILNKLIFNQLKPNQIKSLEKLGSSSAIKILQKFIIEYFKEKLTKNNKKKNNQSHTQKTQENQVPGDQQQMSSQVKAGSGREDEEGIMQADELHSNACEPSAHQHPPWLNPSIAHPPHTQKDNNHKRKLGAPDPNDSQQDILDDPFLHKKVKV